MYQDLLVDYMVVIYLYGDSHHRAGEVTHLVRVSDLRYSLDVPTLRVSTLSGNYVDPHCDSQLYSIDWGNPRNKISSEKHLFVSLASLRVVTPSKSSRVCCNYLTEL